MSEKEGAVFTLGEDALRNQKRISEIAGDMRGTGAGSHMDDWAENLRESSGYLIEGIEQTLTTLSGSYRHEERTGRPEEEDGVEAVQVNLIAPRFARFISRHANLMDGARVQPATDDPEDIRQSKAGGRTIEAMWLNGFEKFVMRNLVYMLCCERSYALVEGDPNLHIEMTPNGPVTNGGRNVIGSDNKIKISDVNDPTKWQIRSPLSGATLREEIALRLSPYMRYPPADMQGLSQELAAIRNLLPPLPSDEFRLTLNPRPQRDV